jgi:hypothetical protein
MGEEIIGLRENIKAELNVVVIHLRRSQRSAEEAE